MGKRSDFERVERDYYRTFDPRAVAPLIPHLKPHSLYSEPCAGAGDLIVQLAARGFQAQDAMDIEPQSSHIRQGDVLTSDLGQPEQFITNPPWLRKFLHPLIVRLSDIAPTWLLFDSDWAFTKQAERFRRRCRKIVVVGRLRWIPDTAQDGKDNCAWYLFDKPSNEPTQFFFHSAGHMGGLFEGLE